MVVSNNIFHVVKGANMHNIPTTTSTKSSSSSSSIKSSSVIPLVYIPLPLLFFINWIVLLFPFVLHNLVATWKSHFTLIFLPYPPFSLTPLSHLHFSCCGCSSYCKFYYKNLLLIYTLGNLDWNPYEIWTLISITTTTTTSLLHYLTNQAYLASHCLLHQVGLIRRQYLAAWTTTTTTVTLTRTPNHLLLACQLIIHTWSRPISATHLEAKGDSIRT